MSLQSPEERAVHVLHHRGDDRGSLRRIGLFDDQRLVRVNTNRIATLLLRSLEDPYSRPSSYTEDYVRTLLVHRQGDLFALRRVIPTPRILHDHLGVGVNVHRPLLVPQDEVVDHRDVLTPDHTDDLLLVHARQINLRHQSGIRTSHVRTLVLLVQYRVDVVQSALGVIYRGVEDHELLVGIVRSDVPQILVHLPRAANQDVVLLVRSRVLQGRLPPRRVDPRLDGLQLDPQLRLRLLGTPLSRIEERLVTQYTVDQKQHLQCFLGLLGDLGRGRRSLGWFGRGLGGTPKQHGARQNYY